MRYSIIILLLTLVFSNMGFAIEELSDGPGFFSGKSGEFSLFTDKKTKETNAKGTLRPNEIMNESIQSCIREVRTSNICATIVITLLYFPFYISCTF